MFVDTHTHLHFPQFEKDLKKVVSHARDSGVQQIITLGIDLASSLNALKIARSFDGLFAAAGIHPSEAHRVQAKDYDRIKQLIQSEVKIVAIGETGLDFYRDRTHTKDQYRNFQKMLQMAIESDLPVVIHNRSAHREMEWFFQEQGITELKGVMHCFSGEEIDARFYLEMELHISFTGNITYKNSRKLQVVKYIPLDRLLLETDSPYMSPEPVRNRRNEPAYISFIAQKLAEIHHKSVEEIARITTQNAQRLFQLDAH